eukprot:TRINITY_DN1368_c0_g1_i2.p1 TRINITY_DN1368_c0_g1~~TRINITY_DN1368_c0_g1_i2.p1  ORF type:complete len:291 (-),score=72.76 TRINITY_DN1368_c0_g1_i2:1787-2659(-)
MVDYSKWDKMAADMSDSEDEEGGSKPVVTAFDHPTSVTWGGGDAPEEERLAASEAAAAPQADKALSSSAGTPGADDSERAALTDKPARLLTLTRNGAAVQDDSGAYTYFWSQSRGDVAITVVAPPGTRASEVEVKVTSDASAPTLAAQAPLGHHLKVSAKGATLLEGDLTYPVALDLDDPESVDWVLQDLGLPARQAPENAMDMSTADLSAEDSPARAITVTLRKHSPIAGAALWWKGAVQGGPTIDMAAIEGRDSKGASASQKVWDEAMEGFRARVKQLKSERTEIDIG